jgi:hypothetical protein
MKSTDKLLDFDFIGSQEPLTKEDKDLISEFFKTKKFERTSISKRKATKNQKTKQKVS